MKLTIGQLARQLNLPTSTLRYYEEQGLLFPAGRTQAGYRLYDPSAERTLRFIRRAQRLGFSLADIRTLLQVWQAGSLDDETVTGLAEARFLDLERRLTEILVLRHEMELLMSDLQERRAQAAGGFGLSLFDRLLDQICAGPLERGRSDSILGWLAERSDCALASSSAQSLLKQLRGRHVHLWQADDSYQILVVGDDPAIKEALEQLAQLEALCQIHSPPRIEAHEEGYLFVARGENAFIYARLFLALEQESPAGD